MKDYSHLVQKKASKKVAVVDDKKEKLIKALEEERDRLVSSHGKDPKDWDYAIEYLRTGKINNGKISTTDDIVYDYGILDGCINDLETVYNDYLN